MSLPPRANSVDEFDLVRDIALVRTPVLIICHLGFYSEVGRFDLDFASIPTRVVDYPDLQNPHPDRTIPNPHFDSMIGGFAGYCANYCLFPDELSIDILSLYSLLFRNWAYGHCARLALFLNLCLFLSDFLSRLFFSVVCICC